MFSFSQICDFGLARLEEPHESAVMTQEVNGTHLQLKFRCKIEYRTFSKSPAVNDSPDFCEFFGLKFLIFQFSSVHVLTVSLRRWSAFYRLLLSITELQNFLLEQHTMVKKVCSTERMRLCQL